MLHRIKSVKPLDDLTISVIFRNGIEVEYDIKQLYNKFPQFRQLEHMRKLYENVRVDIGGYGIVWNDELDLDADVIWDFGRRTGNIYSISVKELVAERLAEARWKNKLTQKQLSDITFIYQADISKIENGVSNPSIETLERLADGMGMKLDIRFIPK